MPIRKYKVTLDTKNSIAPEPVLLRQGDKTGAVVIDATLMDNGSPVSIYGLTPSFMANTADGKAVISDNTGFNIVNASGGEFTYKVPSQLGSVDGKIKIAYFSFSDSSGTQSTFNVVFVVEKAADMDHESAKDWVSNLNEIINQYNQWVNNAHSSWADFVDSNKKIIESIDPGGTLLTEVIDARKPKNKPSYATLGERLNDMPSRNDVDFGILSQIDLGGDVPSSWQPDVDTFIANLPANQFKVLIVTDTHYEDLYDPGRYSYKYASDGLTHLSVVNQIADHVDVVIAGGDNINGLNGDKARDRSDLELYATKLLTTVTSADKFLLVGNHDDNSASMRLYGKAAVKPMDVLSDADFEDIYQTRDSQFGENRNNGSLYFYKDYPDSKIRLIGLNGLDVPQTTNDDGSLKYLRYVDYSYGQDQLNWLANTALATTPADYAVAIVDHIPVVDYKPSGETHYYNATLLKNLLAAYAAGTTFSGSSDDGTPADIIAEVSVDFSKAGPRKIAGLWCGHVHMEKLTPLSGYTQVLYLCDVNVFPKNVGTIDAVGLQVACIDTTTKTVTIRGLGRSTNRSYTY